MLKKQIAILLIFSLIITICVIYSSLKISKEYYNTHSFFYDPVMSYSQTIPFYKRMQQEAHLNQFVSRVNFAILHFKADPKAPFSLIPTIFFFPQLLASPWAMIPSVSLMLFVFLFILGYSLYIRKHSILYCFSIMIFFCAAPVLYNPERGIVAGWLDLPASLLLVSGIISFLNWNTFKKNQWLIFCGIFISFACLSRSTLIVYAFILLGFPFFYSIIQNYYKHKNVLNEILKPLLIILLTVFLLLFHFYFYHFKFNYWYYTHLSSGIANSIKDSFNHFMKVIPIIGSYYLIIFLLFISLIIIQYYKKINKVCFQNIYKFAWIILILPFMWIFINKTGNTYHVYLIEFTLLFLLFIPFDGSIFKNSNFTTRIGIPLFILFFSIFSILFAYNTNLYIAKNPSQEAREIKQLNKKISSYIITLKKGETWLAYFDDDYTRISNCEAYFQYGYYPDAYAKGILYMHNVYWRSYYPNLTNQQIADSLCSLIPQTNLIITFANKKDIDKIISPNFSISRKVLYSVYDYLENNPMWLKVEVFKTKKYSNLAFYKKL